MGAKCQAKRSFRTSPANTNSSCNDLSGTWKNCVDPFVDQSSRWHSSHSGAIETSDVIGDTLVATLQDAALAAEDDHVASIIAIWSQELLHRLIGYEKETRLLVKLADTGRVVTVLLQAMRTSAEILNIQDVHTLIEWREMMDTERGRRMEFYETVLRNDAALAVEIGNEKQQLELLTLMKNDVEIYGAVLTEREMGLILKLYTWIVRRSGIVVGTIPSWFATTTCSWPNACQVPAKDLEEEELLRQVAIWSELRYPHVRKLYGACHVGEPFIIHEVSSSPISVNELSRKDVLSFALGLRYVHERGFALQNLSWDTLLPILSESYIATSSKKFVRIIDKNCAQSCASNVMALGVALLTRLYFPNTMEQLPKRKPTFLDDYEWKLISLMCSAIPAHRPDMADIVDEIEHFVPIEDANLWATSTNVLLKTENDDVSYSRAHEALQDILRTLDSVCENDTSNAAFYRHVYARLVDVHQQHSATSGASSSFQIKHFFDVLQRFDEYLKSQRSRNSSSAHRLASRFSLYSFYNSLHRDLDRLQSEAPHLLRMESRHWWGNQGGGQVLVLWWQTNVQDDEEAVADVTQKSENTVEDALGNHFLEALQKKEPYTKNATAINFLSREVEKELAIYKSEPRILIQWAYTGHVVRVISRAIDSALGILNLKLEKELWYQAFRIEREERVQKLEKLLADKVRLSQEMGDRWQVRELYTLLTHSLGSGNILSTGENKVTSTLSNELMRKLDGEAMPLPSWFASSESKWSFAQRSVLSIDEKAFVEQVNLWAQLNHPNVCKFYGAYHVGYQPFVIHDGSYALTAKLLSEQKNVWSKLLDYAHGLQYIHSRGLAYEALSLKEFWLTWDGKRVLNGMGLARLADGDRSETSAASNVFDFGLAAFEVLASKYLSPDGTHDLHRLGSLSESWLESIYTADWTALVAMDDVNFDIPKRIVQIAKETTEAEWTLLCSMCDAQLDKRPDAPKIVRQIKGIVRTHKSTKIDSTCSTQEVPERILVQLSDFEHPSSGLKLKEMLDEISELCDAVDQFTDTNRLVVNRFTDIYTQLENFSEPLSYPLVEDFGGLIQRFYDQICDRLDECDFGKSVAMHDSVVLTIADKNFSLHHQIDEVLWKSNSLNNISAVHQWREISRHQTNLSLHRLTLWISEDEVDSTDSKEHPPWLLPSDEVQIHKQIASGSFGAAYWGKWMGTDVVVKKVLTDQLELRNRQQFRHEAGLWFSLNHANVIKLYGACEEKEKQSVFVCERAINGTLTSFLKDKTRQEVWRSLYSASQGLRYLHEREIVHGDLKGNNILVCDNNLVKLADFGLSVIATRSTLSNDFLGKLGAIRWKAPECINGMRSTFPSDIYSFGMCIVEAVTGRFPWSNLSDPSVEFNVVKQKRLPPRSADFNDEEWELVRRMCCFDGDSRIDVSAAVCLLYQLYSGNGSVKHRFESEVLAEQTNLELQRYNALRKRAQSCGDIFPNWVIPSDHINLGDEIGRGAFATLHLARWLGANVLVKLLKETLKKYHKVFCRHLGIWVVFNHPNVIRLHGVVSIADRLGFVCELAPGGDLPKYLKLRDRQEIWCCLLGAALGVQYLHSCGIIHGNLNGNTILVSEDGTAKLSSFGYSIFAGSSQKYDGDHHYPWQAPEVLEGEKPTFAADVYSLGMCIIEAVTGDYPWGKYTPDAVVLLNVVQRKLLPSRPKSLDDQEWGLVRAMCRPDPESRISIDTVVCFLRHFSQRRRD